MLLNVKKYILPFFVAILILGTGAAWAGKQSTITDGTPGCKDPITIEIAGIKLSVPRYGTGLHLGSYEDIEDLEKRCDTHFIGNVLTMSWPHESLGDPRGSPSFLTGYERFKGEIDAAHKEGRVDKISNGLERIMRGASEIYIFSSKLAPTKNSEPIVYDCSGHQEYINRSSLEFCYVVYLHPSGLFLSYKFDRRHYSPSAFLTLDQEKRQRIKEMMQSAK